ncbi:MAG: hypothetical protein Q7R41_14705 [Phycisphaerales bacterium]|nr:hypothetical protein [Phycisphaerales bacterium]
MAETQVIHDAGHDVQSWQALAELALRGLRNTYGFDTSFLPHTMRWDGRRATPHGRNTRYVLISLLGLARARAVVEIDDEFVGSLWARVARTFATVAHSPGDLGLGLWARALHGCGHSLFSAERALKIFRERDRACDSVDLAWLLLGADHALFHGVDDGSGEQLAEGTKRALLALYNPESKLFYRHARGGPFAGISRRIACFANQIYAVMALAIHARRTGCEESAMIGREVADNLCRLQGPLGQWWWLYDAKRGPVVDGYPVFSVHQDGMAPMALLETTAAGGRSFAREVERGFAWISGENELRRNLVHREEGLVLRDIHRSGVGRTRRMIRAATWRLGWRGRANAGPAESPFVVNHECRPYHLGWILYAAALVHRAIKQCPPESIEANLSGRLDE